MSNNNTASVSATTSDQAVSLNPRWMCVNVVNTGSAVAFVTTNGSVTSSGSPPDGQVAIPAGGSQVLTNQLPMWNQSQTIIANGSNNQWSQALDGQIANPGTTVHYSGASATTLVIEGCG